MLYRNLLVLPTLAISMAAAHAGLSDAELCQAHISARAWNAAIVSCGNAIESSDYKGPALGLLHSTRGDALTQKDQTADAIDDYTKAIELDPSAAAPRFARGGVYLRQGHSDKAIADFKEVVRLRPDNIFAQFGLGSAYVQKKAWRDAIAPLSAAIRLKQDYGIAYRLRAEAYAALGDTTKADADRKTAKKFGIADRKPRTAPTADETAALQVDAAAPKSRDSKNAAVDQFVLVALSECAKANANKDWDQAVATCTRAIESRQLTGSRLAGALGDRAIAQDEALRPVEAMADYNKALSIDPGNAVILANRATSLAKDGEIDKAMADFNAAIKARPKFGFAYAMRGLTYDAMGETAKAKTDMKRAYDLGERHPVLVEKLRRMGLAE